MTDTTKPIIEPISPAPNSKNNPIDSTIEIQISDSESGIDVTTIDVTINGDYGFKNGVLQAGFDGYYIPNPTINNVNVYLSRTQPYDYLQSINISASAKDLSGNYAETRVYSFISADNVAPQIIDIVPPDQAYYIDGDQVITFSVTTTPYQTEINKDSLTIKIGSQIDGYGNIIKETICSPDPLGGLIYDRRVVSIQDLPNNLGFSVQIIPLENLPLATIITLDIEVADTAGNIATSNTSFSTIDDSPPTLIDIIPLPGSVNNSLTSVISFTITDLQDNYTGSGIKLDSIQVRVQQQIVISNGTVQQGFIGSIIENRPKNGYDIVIIPTTLWTPRNTIDVVASALDNNNNLLTTGYVFSTEDVVPPQISFVTPQNLSTNVPQQTPIIIDIVSEVSTEEIDIGSLFVSVNNQVILQANQFVLPFSGSITRTADKTLTIVCNNNSQFLLGESVILFVSVCDVFGNLIEQQASFTITSTTTLKSIAMPEGAIYDRSDSSTLFPPVGSFLDVVLQSNSSSSTIVYTIDGSDPMIDVDGNPTGSTSVYTQPIRIIDNEVVRFFCFTEDERESKINTAVYVFTNCPELDTWSDHELQQGLEYTLTTKINKLLFSNNNLYLAPTADNGYARYVHDLGRVCYVDNLLFIKRGICKFRAKVVDALNQLPTTNWLNQLTSVVTNNYVTIIDGYGITVNTNQDIINISGRSQLSDQFADEGKIEINQTLLSSFTINGEMKLNVSPNQVTGAKTFIRVFDDNHTCEVQQIISKSSTLPVANQNAILNQPTSIFNNNIYLDNGQQLVDGYDGYLQNQMTPEQVVETIGIIKTEDFQFIDNIQLPSNANKIHRIASISPSVYNKFMYSDGYQYTYSSALAGLVKYIKMQGIDQQDCFAIPVIEKSFDGIINAPFSDNLNTTIDQYEPAERGKIFTTQLFLEPGDYNFRYFVGDRIVSNPFIFKTKQNLSLVAKYDYLVASTQSYQIESVYQTNDGMYVIEFVSQFQHTTDDIINWEIQREQQTLIVSTEKIIVENPLNATIGEDPSGPVANIIITTRRQVQFTYVSATAQVVSLIGTFNNYNPTANVLKPQLDYVEIIKIFDNNQSTEYVNAHRDNHRCGLVLALPTILDRIVFSTNVEISKKQRVRLLIDDIPITSSQYRCYYSNGTPATYLNSTDIYAGDDYDYLEWRANKAATFANQKHSKIAIQTRFDIQNQFDRRHKSLQIYSNEVTPILVTDYCYSTTNQTITRKNNSDFAASSNQVRVDYSTVEYLTSSALTINSIKDAGIVNNFLKSNIIASESSSKIYVDRPYLFSQGEKIIAFDGVNLTYSTIKEVNTRTGLIETESTIGTTGYIVKDYSIIEDSNNFYVNLQIPKFNIQFMGTINQSTVSSGRTTLQFNNYNYIDATSIIGARLTYPLIQQYGTILAARNYQQLIDNVVVNFLEVIVDCEIVEYHPQVGVAIETFNQTQVITDYIINKNDNSIICVDNSGLSSGIVTIDYKTETVPYQSPVNMKHIQVDPIDQVKIEVIPTSNSVTLAELKQVTISFFNGVEGQAPEQIQIAINDYPPVDVQISEAISIDGYSGLYDPLLPNTGQILLYQIPMQVNNATEFLEKIQITFTGKADYYVGEIEARADVDIINSRCRVLLDNQQLYISNLKVEQGVTFDKYQIQVDNNLLKIYYNGNKVVVRPITLFSPTIQFGASGKVLDDPIDGSFKQIVVDQYFTESPSQIQQTGRFIEIEGSIISNEW